MVASPAGDDVEFCELSGGTFQMGCPENSGVETSCNQDEMPAHQVALSPFALARYEVTQRQFAAFIAAQPAWAPGRNAGRVEMQWQLPSRMEWNYASGLV